MENIKITSNFSLNEFIDSSTANKKGIDNSPNGEEVNNIVNLAKNILQPIRDAYGKPIKINSGYRCKKLNDVVKGSKTSQHLTGDAADIIAYDGNNRKLFDIIYRLIKLNQIQVGQLIDEYNYKWIHISNPRNNKPNNQILHLT